MHTQNLTALTLVLSALAVALGLALEASLFLSPVGEFSFVIASAGLSVGVLTIAGHKLAIAVIAMSLLVSPLFFLGARIFHRLAAVQLKVMGLNLGELRFRRGQILAPALPDPGE